MAEACEPGLFTQRMRVASREAHSVSDSLVNAKLLVAFANQTRYGCALSLFYHVFEAIENHMESLRNISVIQPLAKLLPLIRRAPAFEADLLYLLGPGWHESCKAPPAVQAYLEHLQILSDSAPHLLLAHCYTQQSAILAGGQMIRRLARKSMRLPEDKGTCVFEFQTSPNELRRKWTVAVNAAAGSLSAEHQEQVLKEHCRVFEFNNNIVSEFQVSWTDWGQTAIALLPRAILVGGATVGCGLALWAASRTWGSA